MGPERQGGLIQAGRSVAIFLALGATIFVAPRFWRLVDSWVWAELMQVYDSDTAALLFVVLQYASYPLVFFALQMGLVLMLSGIALIVMRWLV